MKMWLHFLHEKMMVFISDGFVHQVKACLPYPVFDLRDPGVVMVKAFLRPVGMIPPVLCPFAINHRQARLLACCEGVLQVLRGGEFNGEIQIALWLDGMIKIAEN